LTSMSVMGAEVPGDTRAVPPVIFPDPPEIVGADHQNVAPVTEGLVVSVRFAAVPLQIVCTNPDVTDGVGFTVTTSVEGVPVQLPGAGVVGVKT